MKPSLQLKIGQQLTMTPQLQQAIRLLQLSTLDLQQEIQETVESNPMLDLNEDSDHSQTESIGDTSNDNNGSTDQAAAEIGANGEADPQKTASDEALNNSLERENSPEQGSPGPENTTAKDAGDSAESAELQNGAEEWGDNIPDDLPVDSAWDDVYQDSSFSHSSGGGDDLPGFEATTTSVDTIQDHLLWQLNLTPMSDVDRIIAMNIIDSVNSDGYLEEPLDIIFENVGQQLEKADLHQQEPLEMDEVEAVLHRLQHFDPVGVCAKDLSDCLCIQLDQLPPDTPWVAQAKQILCQHMALLGNRDYNQLMRRAKLKEPELREVIQLIQSLNPKPAEDIGGKEPEYVIPDVVVKKENGRWRVELNSETMPKVRINPTYAALVKRADNSNDNNYLRDHLQEARWFLKSIQSRNETLLKVASEIVAVQRGFLEHGDEAMKPLVLHDIARAVDMHESTISRVTTQKYMHTPRGIFELKYFFSSQVDTDSGGGCSSTAIRAIIKKLVAAETPNKPLSDSKIADVLADQGIKVARRTIAKYRESMQIPPSNERKRLV